MPESSDERVFQACRMFSDACQMLGLTDIEAIMAAAQCAGLCCARLATSDLQMAAMNVAADRMITAYRGQVAKDAAVRRGRLAK